jgi:hypothetical protein
MFGKQSSIVCNMRLYPLFVLATLSLLFSCKSETDNGVIRLDGSCDENFLESWEYIILEDDNPDALLGFVDQEIRYDDGLFFISSEANNNSSIKVFDRTGHYRNIICRTGRARNECLSLNSWTLDTYNNQVVVAISNGYGASVSIKRFDYQGNYLGQMETDTLGADCILGNIVKCTADGTLLIEDNKIHGSPSHEYFNIHKDGSISTLLELSEYHTNGVGVDPTSFFQTGILKPDYELGHTTIMLATSNPYSDTSYVTRKFDNGIYRICGDKAELINRLPFIPEAPQDMRKSVKLEQRVDYDPYQVWYFKDMKDYVYLMYGDGEYMFEKATSTIYEMPFDSINAICPYHAHGSAYGNDIISVIDDYGIKSGIERMEREDHDQRYGVAIKEFFKRTQGRSNPVIVIAHYKDVQ